MRHRFAARPAQVAAAILGAAAAAIAMAVPATAQSAQSAQSAAARSAAGAPAVPSAAGAARPVLLINGDQLVPRAGGGSTVLPAPGSGPVVTLGQGSHAAYIPLDALPYLGAGLAAGLFSPGSLDRAESGGRLRVQVAFTGRRPHLPGLTITQSANGTARGYLTRASARVFGAALARQVRADHGRASYGRDGMFANGVSIAPAGTSPALARRRSAPRPRPDFPMGELTVHATNEAGQPDTGDPVVVFNAANWRTFGDPIEVRQDFYHGVAKYSVPDGTYWAVSWFAHFGQAITPVRIDVLPQFTVRGRTQVRVSARAATSKLTVVTPRPSVHQGFAYQITRLGLHGTANEAGLFGDPGDTLFVNRTTTRPSVGSLRVYLAPVLSSPPGAPGVPYAYNLVFAGPAGILPRERWTASPARLATVTERFYQEVPGTGEVGESADYTKLVIGFGGQGPVRMPGEQIQYLTGSPEVAYTIFTSQYSGNYFPGGQAGSLFSVRPGQRLTEDWNADPLRPQATMQLLSGSLVTQLHAEVVPSAYRVGNTLALTPFPFSDNVPGHIGAFYFNYPGSGVKIGGRYAIRQDGVLVAHGTVKNEGNALRIGLPPVTLSPKPGVIRFELTATRRGVRYPLSPVSQTVWTWHSAPDPSAMLPRAFLCPLPAGRRCAVQPMLTLNYQVHGLAMNEATGPGRQVIGLTVGHIEPSAPVRVSRASVQVSVNGGHTWQSATVTPAGPGRFTVSFTAPAGAEVTLRTSAADAAGGSITETIQDAYRA